MESHRSGQSQKLMPSPRESIWKAGQDRPGIFALKDAKPPLGNLTKSNQISFCKASAAEWRPSPLAKGILYRKALRTASSRCRRACADCFRSRLRRLGFASPPRARPRSGPGQTTTPSPRARSKPELSTLLKSGTFYFALTPQAIVCRFAATTSSMTSIPAPSVPGSGVILPTVGIG